MEVPAMNEPSVETLLAEKEVLSQKVAELTLQLERTQALYKRAQTELARARSVIRIPGRG